MARPVPTKHIVVVCLANQCRSPMGELLLARALEGTGIEVTSAGLEAMPGLPATASARRAVERRFGQDLLAGHKASLLTAGLMGQADLILVMTAGQKQHLLGDWSRVIDGLDDKLFTIGEFAGRPSTDVDDPVGKPDARYDACLALLEELTSAAAARLTG
jgi:protein-tyrosine phosphatase